jgi:HK97 family phage major capsid protein
MPARTSPRRGRDIEIKAEEVASAGEIRALQDRTQSMLAQVEELMRPERLEGKGAKDPLAEQSADRAIRALHEGLAELRAELARREFEEVERKAAEDEDEIKSLHERIASLETSQGRPPRSGRSSFDYEVEGGDAPDYATEYKSAFAHWARTGSERGFEAFSEAFELKDMTSIADPQGGFFVPPVIDAEINRILLDSGGFRSIVRVRTIDGQQYKKRTMAKGVDAGWVGETDARTKTGTPEFEEIDIGVGELYAKPQVSQVLLEDSNIDIESELAMEVADAFEQLENDAFLNGDGLKGKPRGLLKYAFAANATAKSWGQFGYIASGSTTGIAKTSAGDELDKLIALQHALKPGYRNGASWIMNDATMSYLRKIKDADGYPILQTMMASGVTMLLGSPINIVQEMPDIASNAYAMGYGVWDKTYTIIDRVGSTTDRFYDASTVPYVQFYTRKRLGGGVEFFEAAKFMKFATS